MTLFDDGKEAGALRSIGEVSASLGIRTHVLRYWEQQFAQLKPLKRAGGRRLYRPEYVALIARIDRLVNREGYTLKGVKAVLNSAQTGQAGGENAPRPRNPAASDILPRLKAIRAELAAALAA